MINLQNIINFLKDNPEVSLISNELNNLLTNYNSNDWEQYESYDESHYKKNLVFRNHKFEIFIICWNSKKGSKVHDHSANGCIFKILKGKLTEYRYDTKSLELKELSCLPKDTISYIDNEIGYHKIINDTKSETVSLHIYSPPKYEGNIYCVNKNVSNR
jgi:cysteine dioxygenase